jgi:flavin-dependent dehydrogenase
VSAEDTRYDVCVVGGGPAGASLGLRLAQLGRRVAVVERMAFPRPHVGESLAAGIRPLLDVLGVEEAVSAAGFQSSAWATVSWAGEPRRFEVPGGPGLLVDRGRFDALLLQATAAMPSVKVYQPARVLGAERRDDCWKIALDSGETLRASYLADAAGGAHLRLSPRGDAGRRQLLGARTLALYAYWDLGGEGNEACDSLVESAREAWYWGAPLPGGLFNAIVFVDPGGRRDYEALIQESALLGTWLRGRRRVSELVACDATPSAAAVPITLASLKVGDAALFVDPISSQGVQTAIGTALHAAIVINTQLDSPRDADLAIAFYRRRLRDSATFHATAAASFYRPQADASGHDFWRRRAAAAETVAATTSNPPLGRHPRAGLLSPTARVSRAADVTFAPVAVATPSHVARAEGVTARGKEYAFVGRGIAIAPLLAQIEAPMSALDVVSRWSRSLRPQEALQILQWAWQEALLAPADVPPSEAATGFT